MFGVIDRFEGDYAVVEFDNQEIRNIERSLLPDEAREGDVIRLVQSYVVDKEETARRRDEVAKLGEGLWE